MSSAIHGLVKRHVVGSSAAKAVLLFIARASDDRGAGFCMSKADMAADLEMSKRSVQRAVSELCARGLISEGERHPCQHGYILSYAIDLEAVAALPSTAAQARRDTPVGVRKRLAVYRRDGFRCGYCGSADNLTIDHRRPRSRGGGNDEDNLITACGSCNSAKGAKTEAEFRATLGREAA